MKKFWAKLFACVLLCASVAGMGACNSPESGLKVFAPDGAPALSLLCAIDGERQKTDSAFDFNIVDSGNIQTYVGGKDPQADFCILPVNLAAKLLGTGEVYEMLGVVTNGNLYFLTSGDAAVNAPLTAENFKDALTGKKVGVVQLSNAPGLTLRVVLRQYGAEANILQDADQTADPEKVNLVPFDAEDVSPAAKCDYYLCPEPAASTKIKGTQSSPVPFRMAGDLQQLYVGSDGYPQAVAVAKKSVIESDPAAVSAFVAYLEGAETYLETVSADTVLNLLEGVREDGLKASFNANNLSAQVIANCSVRFTASSVCKADVTAFLDRLIKVSPQSAARPSDTFFYLG